MHSEGFKIKNGYDFMGANFNSKSIYEKPTNDNKVVFKIISEESHFIQLLDEISSTKEVYQFYKTAFIDFKKEIKHIKIQTENLSDVIKIVVTTQAVSGFGYPQSVNKKSLLY